MKPFIVLKYSGKGSYSSADYVSVHLFKSYQEAVDFCQANRTLGKYWTFCEILEEGERFEPTI